MIFIECGELLMRLDERFQFLAANKIVKIKTTVEDTPEFEMVKNNSINLNGNNLRVMVLGDSYIHGGGINFKDNFSQQLKILLQNANRKYESIYVLDISKPSSNTLDNTQAYFEFAGKFKPDIVVLGYNYNDVEGNLEKNKLQDSTVDFSKKKTSTSQNERLIQKIYKIIYKSKVIQYTLHNIHDEMKAHGYIMPNSVFDLTLKSYYQDKDDWKKSKVLLQEMIDDCKKNNSQFIVLKFTEINLLEYKSIFKRTDSCIHSFFASSPSVDYVDVSDIFKGEKSKDNILSKYDGHPNEKAHKKIARGVFEEIKKINLAKADFK
jgi:hypothetical protein